MTEKRFTYLDASRNKYIGSFFCNDVPLTNDEVVELLNTLNNENEREERIQELEDENEHLIRKRGELETKNVILEGENKELKTKVNFYKYFQKEARKLEKENEQLKAQLYCDDEEGVCSICKYHYLVIDDEAELEWYNSRCTKGHYECGKVCLKKCEDFEKRKKKL